MSQQEKVDVLRKQLLARKWDLEYCRLITELAMCAGLREPNAVSVVREVFKKSRVATYQRTSIAT